MYVFSDGNLTSLAILFVIRPLHNAVKVGRDPGTKVSNGFEDSVVMAFYGSCLSKRRPKVEPTVSGQRNCL